MRGVCVAKPVGMGGVQLLYPNDELALRDDELRNPDFPKEGAKNSLFGFIINIFMFHSLTQIH
jgi:hypothetical protein